MLHFGRRTDVHFQISMNPSLKTEYLQKFLIINLHTGGEKDILSARQKIKPQFGDFCYDETLNGLQL